MSFRRVSVFLMALLLVPMVSAHGGEPPHVDVFAPGTTFTGALPMRITWHDDPSVDPPQPITKIVVTIGEGPQANVTEYTPGATKELHLLLNITEGFALWKVEGYRGQFLKQADIVEGVAVIQDPLASVRDLLLQMDGDVTRMDAVTQLLLERVILLEAAREIAEREPQANFTSLSNDIGALRSKVDAVYLASLYDSPDEPVMVQSESSPLTVAGSMTSAFIALGVLVLVGIMQWQSARRHQEQMVLILALAARLDVTPESEEFQKAMAALST